MEFLSSMDTSQKIILGIGLVAICALLIMLFMGNKVDADVPRRMPPRRREVPMMDPQQAQMDAGPQQQAPKGLLVLFFAHWCGHCNSLRPTWDQFVQQYNGANGIQIAEVNADEDKQLCDFHGVQGFPTIKYLPNGLNDKQSVDYNGDRSIQDLANFMQQF